MQIVIILPGLAHVLTLHREGRKEGKFAQSCPTLCDPIDCSLPGFSVHGIFQARVLDWFAISFSRGSSQSRDRTQVSFIVGSALPTEPLGNPPTLHKVIFNHPTQWQCLTSLNFYTLSLLITLIECLFCLYKLIYCIPCYLVLSVISGIDILNCYLCLLLNSNRKDYII